MLGVTVTRAALLGHARTLTASCNYTEGEIMVCVLDFKREVGLWHAIVAAVFNGMHVIFIPYALMKVSRESLNLRIWPHQLIPYSIQVNPASWMQMVTKHRATVAVCKSRDLHWGLLATKVGGVQEE